MLKIFMLFSLALNTLNNKFLKINSIEHFYNEKNISLVFNIESDYLNEHTLNVIIDIYDLKHSFLKRFQNDLKLIGNKTSRANLDYVMNDNMYLEITVIYENNTIVNKARIDYHQNQNCFLDANHLSCNEYYKSVYKDDMVYEEAINLKIIKGPFDQYLVNNKLDLSDFIIYSKYDFSNDNVHLIIEDYIEEYQLLYSNGYHIPLEVVNNNTYTFNLINEYYFNTDNYNFKEEKDSFNDTLTDNIYFPFLSDYKEYDCKIIIESLIDIEIVFTVATSDKLFGDCSASKYCLDRGIYD